MGIGNTRPFSWGKQLLPSFISHFLHKRHESVCEQMNGQKEDWNSDSCFHYSPCLLSAQPFSGLATTMRYHNPLGSQFVQFFICFSEEWGGSGGIRQQISFIVSKSHVREMLAQLREIFLWLKTSRQKNKILTGSTAPDNHRRTSSHGSDVLNIQAAQ